MSRHPADRVFTVAIRGAGVVLLGALLLMGVLLCVWAWPAAYELPGGFLALAGGEWSPSRGRFGMAPLLTGTVLVAVLAVLIAAPVGVLAAAFVHTLAPPVLRPPVAGLLWMMAGVPSVVWGFFGLVALVPVLSWVRPPGTSLLAAVLVLAVMLVPTTAVLSLAALKAVPGSSKLAAAGLGLSAVSTLRRVVLPQAWGGILAAALLALCRGLGETLAVLMVAGNLPRFPGGPMDAVRTVTGNLALELGYATGPHRSALFATALLLTLIVAVVLMLARLIHHDGGPRPPARTARADLLSLGPEAVGSTEIGARPEGER